MKFSLEISTQLLYKSVGKFQRKYLFVDIIETNSPVIGLCNRNMNIHFCPKLTRSRFVSSTRSFSFLIASEINRMEMVGKYFLRNIIYLLLSIAIFCCARLKYSITLFIFKAGIILILIGSNVEF